MAIAYVNSVVTVETAAPYAVGYASTAGNTLVLWIGSIVGGFGVPTVKDSNGTSWTVINNGEGGGNYLAYIVNSPAITSVTVTAGSADSVAILGEYSGIGKFVTDAFDSVGGGGTVTMTSSIGAHDWLISCLLYITTSSANFYSTTTAGVYRNSVTQSQSSPVGGPYYYSLALVDNTAATAGSVSCTGVWTGGTTYGWAAAGFDFSIAKGTAVNDFFWG